MPLPRSDLYSGMLPADSPSSVVSSAASPMQISRGRSPTCHRCVRRVRAVVRARHLAPPDLTPAIRQWFIDAEFVEVGASMPRSGFGSATGADLSDDHLRFGVTLKANALH